VITHEVARWMAQRAIEEMPELDDRDLDDWGIDQFQANRAYDLATEAKVALTTESNAATTLQSVTDLHTSSECEVCGRTYNQQPDPVCDCGTEGEEFECVECEQEYPCSTIRMIEREKDDDNT